MDTLGRNSYRLVHWMITAAPSYNPLLHLTVYYRYVTHYWIISVSVYDKFIFIGKYLEREREERENYFFYQDVENIQIWGIII